MPLDPMIANPSGLKLNDPLEQYNNYLLAASRKGAMDKERRAQAEYNALNEVMASQGAVNPDGSPNIAFISNALAKRMLGSAIPGQWEQHMKSGEIGSRIRENDANAGLLKEKVNTEKADQGLKGSQAKKADAEAVESKVKAAENAWQVALTGLDSINADPKVGAPQLIQWFMSNDKDPVLGEYMRSRGQTPETFIAKLKATQGDPKKFQQMILDLRMGRDKSSEKVITNLDLGGTRKVVTGDKYSIGDTPDQNFKVTEAPGDKYKGVRVSLANNTMLGLPAANAFQDKAAGVVGEDYGNAVKMNKGFEQQVAGIDRALDILDSGAVITGAGAKPKLDIVRIAKALGANVDDKMLQNTELLGQQIATSVFNRIATLKSQGVALTPMSNTDLAKIEAAGPQAWNDAGTIRRLFQIEREAVQNARRLYNQQTQHYKRTPETANAVRILGADTLPEIPERRKPGAKPSSPKGQSVRQKYGLPTQ